MAKSIKVESQVIRGFEASIADASLYKAVAKGSAEKFGKKSRAYQTVMNGIDSDKGTGSQYFFNNEAGLYLPEGKRVARFDDLSKVYGADVDGKFFDGTFYTDTPEIVLRSDSPSLQNNVPILENLVNQARERGLKFSSDNPLVLLGLNLVRDDNKKNHYGILLEMNDSTVAVNDPRFAYGTKKIPFGNGTKTSYPKEKGLSRVFFRQGGYVISDSDVLQVSYDNGRVVVFDAEGVASENSEFKALTEKYQTKLRQLRSRIDAKLERQNGK